MQIQVNGESLSVADDINLTALIDQLGLAGSRVAVELNREIVPRSYFAAQTLNDGDQIEIVQAIGGG